MTILSLARHLLVCVSFAAQPVSVPMPGGGHGIGFDDLGWSVALGRVLVPGGRTGKVFLVDPASREVDSIGGFSASDAYEGGHGEGVTTADDAAGRLVAADRGALTVSLLDPRSRKTLASAKLANGPDYARWVAPTNEIWVSEPDAEKVEIFSYTDGKLAREGFIDVPGGPESLVIDARRRLAYTNTWKGQTAAIDLAARKELRRWKNGCAGSRGIALDEAAGRVFVGCAEGRVAAFEGASGKLVGEGKAGNGVDVIAFSPATGEVFAPAAKDATLTVFKVSKSGALKRARVAPAAKGSHCVAADGVGGAWVCDPDEGGLLYYPPR